MAKYDFQRFITRVAAMPSVREMHREVDSASQQAQADAKFYRKRKPDWADQARDYDRQLGGVGFFLHHGGRASGITSHEFYMLRPIAEALVNQGADASILDDFKTPPDPNEDA